ncbi:hypothetical protein Q5752_004706 [Cryptotrichosporon argae]
MLHIHVPRFARLVLLALALILVPSLVLFRAGSHAPAPDRDAALEAGGLDSAHFRLPVRPAVDAYEREQVRGRPEEAYGTSPGWDGGEEEDDAAEDEGEQDSRGRWASGNRGKGKSKATRPLVQDSADSMADLLSGGVIMPKLGNATAKVELGRAAWKLLHLVTLRFPDEPTADDRAALKSYFHLFARLYPCGECAAEFQLLLKKYPPQTSSRKSASLWLCHVHNEVNARLGKPEFDCLTLDAAYDCGCGDEGGDADAAAETAAVGGGGDGGDERGTALGATAGTDGKPAHSSGKGAAQELDGLEQDQSGARAAAPVRQKSGMRTGDAEDVEDDEVTGAEHGEHEVDNSVTYVGGGGRGADEGAEADVDGNVDAADARASGLDADEGAKADADEDEAKVDPDADAEDDTDEPVAEDEVVLAPPPPKARIGRPGMGRLRGP